MQRLLLICLLCQWPLLASGQNDEQHREAVIAEPFIELHTGPGRGYPVFHVAERGQTIEILRRRTDWYQVRVARGAQGWVQSAELAETLGPDGAPVGLPGESTLTDYSGRRWEVGALYGDFGGANVISTYGAFSLTANLAVELWLSEVLGRFSSSRVASVNIVHMMYPQRRVSPFFTLGTGIIHTEPKATLVATVDRTDNAAHAGVGVRTYLTRRFVFRAEYKTYVTFTNRNDNEEVREWKAGFSFFF